jgi:hypothetical protein
MELFVGRPYPWDNGLPVVCGRADYSVVVPRILESVVRTIDKCVPTEFSVFAKIAEIGQEILLGEEYYIPEQVVTASTVEYKETPPAGYDCVVHKHPTGCLDFSFTDREFINANFVLSLLYVDSRFVRASLRVLHQGIVFLLETEKIEILDPEIDVIGLEKIRRKEVKKFGLEKTMYYPGVLDTNLDLYFFRSPTTGVEDGDEV